MAEFIIVMHGEFTIINYQFQVPEKVIIRYFEEHGNVLTFAEAQHLFDGGIARCTDYTKPNLLCDYHLTTNGATLPNIPLGVYKINQSAFGRTRKLIINEYNGNLSKLIDYLKYYHSYIWEEAIFYMISCRSASNVLEYMEICD